MRHNTLVQKRVVFLFKLENHLTNMYLLYRVHTGRYYTGSTKALTAPLCQRGAPNPKAMRSWENPAYLLSLLHKAWDNKEILILSCITSMLLREEERREHSEGRPERACPTHTASFNGFYHTFSGVGHWLPFLGGAWETYQFAVRLLNRTGTVLDLLMLISCWTGKPRGGVSSHLCLSHGGINVGFSLLTGNSIWPVPLELKWARVNDADSSVNCTLSCLNGSRKFPPTMGKVKSLQKGPPH